MWFGCDVGKSMQREHGLLDINMYDFKSAFGTEFGMDKKTRLLYGESLMTHAMVLTAYDREQAQGVGAGSGEAEAEEEAKSKDDGDKKDKKKKELNAPTEGAGAIRAWRVENSWGTDKADKGYLCMTDEWFGEWVYQVAVDRAILDPKILAVLDTEAIVLPAWDPMGALAKSM